MAGEWIAEKARGLMGMIPGQWEESQPGIYQGRCPGEHLHGGGSAATDCRVHLAYGAQGQPPGVYCLHNSCKAVLDSINEDFRTAIFKKDENWRPSSPANAGVVQRAPVNREAWIPEFSFAKLQGLVQAVPPISPEWFMERSPVDPRKVTPGEFLEHCFGVGERVVVFTVFKGPGDFLWGGGRGGFRLSAERGVKAVRSNLPVDGGKDGVWYLCNPVDGAWHANPRRGGLYSRRSQESVTAWRHMVVESDETKTRKKMGFALKDAEPLRREGKADEAKLILAKAGREKWAAEMMGVPVETWPAAAERCFAEAAAIPGLWNKFLAMAALPIKAIYSSGGDSWHALVEVNQESKAEFDVYLRNSAKKFLPIIGADPGAMTPVRLSRLPGCTRGGSEQRLIYLNPEPWVKGGEIKPILSMAKRRSL
jgi:hypothetical protein